MSKTKSAKQKQNSGSNRGKDQAKQKTVAKEVIPKIEKVEMVDLTYPDTLTTPEGKLYFDAIKESCENLTILVHNQDKFMMARLARYMVISDNLLAAGELEPVVTEINGNTNLPQTKTNQNLTAAIQVDRRIDSLVKQLGMSPAARADIYNKMVALKSDDVFDEKTAKVVNQDDMIPGIYAVGSNAKNQLKKLG